MTDRADTTREGRPGAASPPPADKQATGRDGQSNGRPWRRFAAIDRLRHGAGRQER